MKYIMFKAKLLCLLVLISCDANNLPAPKVDEHKTKQPFSTDFKLGQNLSNQCAHCHGKTGLDTKKGAPYIAGQPTAYLSLAMRSYRDHTRKHRTMRKAVLTLNDHEIENISAYYANLPADWKGGHPIKIKQKTIGSVSRGQASSTPCKNCHGEDGNSQLAHIPSLAGLQPEYFLNAFENYFTERRKGTVMSHFKRALNWQQLQDLAAYYAEQKRLSNNLPLPGSPSRGEKAAKQCTGCHGILGSTILPNMPNLAGQNAKYLVNAIKDYGNGKRQNALMKNATIELSATNIRDLASFFAQLSSQPEKIIQQQQGFDPIRAGLLLAVNCQGCHGVNGNSDTPGIPSISGLSIEYFGLAIEQYRNGSRQDRMMHAFAKHLTTSQTEKLALYYAQADLSPRGKKEIKRSVAVEIVAKCNGCHGNKGNSTKVLTPSLAGQDENYLFKSTIDYKTGLRTNERMQNATKELTTENIRELANYYASRNTIAQKQYQLDAPEMLAEKKCGRCHGKSGYNIESNMPRLAGQTETYLFQSVLAYKNGDRIHSLMHAMADVLTLSETEAIAKYYAEQR